MTGARTHDKNQHLQSDIEHEIEQADYSWDCCGVNLSQKSNSSGIWIIRLTIHLIKYETRSLSSVG
jgi:hypothetical protein